VIGAGIEVAVRRADAEAGRLTAFAATFVVREAADLASGYLRVVQDANQRRSVPVTDALTWRFAARHVNHPITATATTHPPMKASMIVPASTTPPAQLNEGFPRPSLSIVSLYSFQVGDDRPRFLQRRVPQQFLVAAWAGEAARFAGAVVVVAVVVAARFRWPAADTARAWFAAVDRDGKKLVHVVRVGRLRERRAFLRLRRSAPVLARP
jgi:hypothetical protein